ncbi:T-cell surface glycoprotein CD3 epsilon chain isoform X2 [Ambystoma mexicanum]|uniref:T-cell surface glycoprotein CD3 epsilon chain isoform X2 n=1 Tax=Ambystoma mexicanum TaxID=8296 RepID=UPI0037E8F9D4
MVSTLANTPVSILANPQDYEIAVRISGTSVFLTCLLRHQSPSKVNSTLRGPNGLSLNGTEHHLENYDEGMNGEYHFQGPLGRNPNVWRLFLKVKVCHHCVDLGFWTVAGILVTDILVTVGVSILVYYWSKGRKRIPAPGGASAGGRRPRDYNKERPPPVPNPDYEPIRKGQREVYDGLKPQY